MPELIVIATPATATGFRLGGARTMVASNLPQTLAAVALAARTDSVSLIAVHGNLWAAVPPPQRERWALRVAPLVIPLPDEDGDIARVHIDALRDLLTRAVGYQITFDPQGDIT